MDQVGSSASPLLAHALSWDPADAADVKLRLRARAWAVAEEMEADHGAVDTKYVQRAPVGLLEETACERARHLRDYAGDIINKEDYDYPPDVLSGPLQLIATPVHSDEHVYLLLFQGSPWAVFLRWLLDAYTATHLDYRLLFTPLQRVNCADPAWSLQLTVDTHQVAVVTLTLAEGESRVYHIYGRQTGDSDIIMGELRRLQADVVELGPAEGPDLGWGASAGRRMRKMFMLHAYNMKKTNDRGSKGWRKLCTSRAIDDDERRDLDDMERDLFGADDGTPEVLAKLRNDGRVREWVLSNGHWATLPRSFQHLKLIWTTTDVTARGWKPHMWALVLQFVAQSSGAYASPDHAACAFSGSGVFELEQTLCHDAFTLKLRWRMRNKQDVSLLDFPYVKLVPTDGRTTVQSQYKIYTNNPDFLALLKDITSICRAAAQPPPPSSPRPSKLSKGKRRAKEAAAPKAKRALSATGDANAAAEAAEKAKAAAAEVVTAADKAKQQRLKNLLEPRIPKIKKGGLGERQHPRPKTTSDAAEGAGGAAAEENFEDLGWGPHVDDVLRLREMDEAKATTLRLATIVAEHDAKYRGVEKPPPFPTVCTVLATRIETLEDDAKNGESKGSKWAAFVGKLPAGVMRRAARFKDQFIRLSDGVNLCYTPIRSTRHIRFIEAMNWSHPWVNFVSTCVLKWKTDNRPDETAEVVFPELFTPEQRVNFPNGAGVMFDWRNPNSPNVVIGRTTFEIYSRDQDKRKREMLNLIRDFNTAINAPPQ